MSRRVSFKSQIKDKDLAIAALNDLGMKCEDAGTVLRILNGPLARATIDLKTGEVVSDSDYHTKDDLGGLRQAYSEQEFKRQARRQGSSIEQRSVLANGDVRILCRMAA